MGKLTLSTHSALATLNIGDVEFPVALNFEPKCLSIQLDIPQLAEVGIYLLVQGEDLGLAVRIGEGKAAIENYFPIAQGLGIAVRALMDKQYAQALEAG